MGQVDCKSRSAARIYPRIMRWTALATLAAGVTLPLCGQYQGHIKKDTDNTPTLRATGVFEWTGDIAKPKAGRLVPIAVWDGSQYQPGGLYLAQPAPLTVYTGTVYELQQAGMPKGLFQVNGAENLQGSWIAIGAVKSETPAARPKRTTAKLAPQVVKDSGGDSDRPTLHRKAGSEGDSGNTSSTSSSGNSSDSDRPTLHRKDAGSGSSQTNSGGSSTSSTSSSPDPDRPTLHRRDTTSDSGSSGSDSDSSQNAPSTDPDRPTLHRKDSSSDSGGSSNAPSVDPDRPTLHRPAAQTGNNSGAPVTATANPDPDRPRLRYGKPEAPVGMVEPSKLEGVPADMNQMAAISDAKPEEAHPYAYSWADPGDAAKMQAAMEDLARKALLGKPVDASPAPTVTKTVTKSAAARRKAAPPQPAPSDLEDEKFGAFELAYNAGATLVLTAKSTGEDKNTKYVTIIAQPDFYGAPQVIFQQVTSDERLDVTPRMRLVDAVDTDADRRAELIFELRGRTGREFAIYRVVNRRVEEAFNTGPLP
jgi:hypothetical protein